ncbi:hypothetical protein CsSME_00050541 [Camellia sinensis var. sinensis]
MEILKYEVAVSLIKASLGDWHVFNLVEKVSPGVCGADTFSSGSIHIALRQIVAKEALNVLYNSWRAVCAPDLESYPMTADLKEPLHEPWCGSMSFFHLHYLWPNIPIGHHRALKWHNAQHPHFQSKPFRKDPSTQPNQLNIRVGILIQLNKSR